MLAMPTPPADDYTSLLRDQIRRAGVATGEVRWLLQLAVGSFLIGMAFFAGLIMVILQVATDRHLAVVVGVAPFLLLVVGVPCWYLGSWVALPLPAAYRELRLVLLRRRLARIPRRQLAEILMPLRDEPVPDVRRLVEPLIRDLHLEGSEVAPAAPLSPSGREPAPVAQLETGDHGSAAS